MKISIVTDEISADPETAFELGASWGMHDFELRGYFTDRVPFFSSYQKRRLQESLDRYESRIIAISPGLFKIPFPVKAPEGFPLAWMDKAFYDGWEASRKILEAHLQDLLPRSIEYALDLGSNLVLAFGFEHAGASEGDPPDEVLEVLSGAAEQVGASGMRLALENEEGFWADSGARTARIVRLVNHPALVVNWDPGNAFFAGDTPYPFGYEELRGCIHHVHYKDARRTPTGVPEVVGEGEIDWRGQIHALAKDGYAGFISIETHLRPKVASAKFALDRLRNCFVDEEIQINEE